MDKMGFVTPEEVWMRENLRPFILKILNSSGFHKRPFWDADAVVKDYLEFVEGRSLYSPEIWRIICTELWLQKFFDHRSELSDSKYINPGPGYNFLHFLSFAGSNLLNSDSGQNYVIDL